MQGLRTQEDKKFNNFMHIVQSFAAKEGGVFFLECGEGHDIIRDDFEGEDLCGWLIPADRAADFEKEFRKFNVDEDKWEPFECFANWHESDGEISISFDKMAVEFVD